MPLAHIELLQEIVAAGNTTAGVIAGLEFLRWDEYSALVNNLPDIPDSETWTAGGTHTQFVNAAIILIREASGQVRKYVQPKRNPSDAEAPTHFPNENVILFRSNDQAPGRRLNFCIQICSDFTQHTSVSSLRRDLESVGDSRLIDFTFLLQRNADQFAPQFLRSIQEYFEPPDQMIDTSHGCLVFANVASESHGKSDSWGRSMLVFPYDTTHWREAGTPTYWLRDESALNQRAAVLREPGTCIYWLRYKPHYLVSSIRGSGQPGPFVSNHAFALKLKGETFPDTAEFEPIPAVAHWIISEWADSKERIQEQLGDIPADVWNRFSDAYEEILAEWRSALEQSEESARHSFGLYFLCFHDKLLRQHSMEPMDWDDDIAARSRRLLAVCCLLRSGLAHGIFNLSPGPYEHANILDTTGVALICGRDKAISSVLVEAIPKIDTPEASSARDQYSILIVDPSDNQDTQAIARLVASCRQKFTSSKTEQDDITSAEASSQITALCDQSIWGAVTGAEDASDMSSRITATLGLA